MKATPERCHSKVTYTLTPDGELWVEMESTTDAPTIVNLVHHTYWNIAGQATNNIDEHSRLQHTPIDIFLSMKAAYRQE